jgi:hypothetical protein
VMRIVVHSDGAALLTLCKLPKLLQKDCRLPGG